MHLFKNLKSLFIFSLFLLSNTVHAANYFLEEIQRLENAGADFAHSERMCRLKYLNNLFDFDESINGEEKIIIQKTIDKIDRNTIGHALINYISAHLSQYHLNVVREMLDKKKIDNEDEQTSVEALIPFNKIFFIKSQKTLFECPKKIPKNTDYWADNLHSYKKYFQLIVHIKDFENVDISVLPYGLNETQPALTSFKRILFHEFVHILDYLEDDENYRLNNLKFSWKPLLNAWFPSLADKHDGLKLEESWDGRMTEVQAVIGREFDEDLDIGHISNFSELSFSIAEKDDRIRLPYATCPLSVHKDTSNFLFNNGLNQVSKLLHQEHKHKDIFILRSYYSKEY